MIKAMLFGERDVTIWANLEKGIWKVDIIFANFRRLQLFTNTKLQRKNILKNIVPSSPHYSGIFLGNHRSLNFMKNSGIKSTHSRLVCKYSCILMHDKHMIMNMVYF